MVVVLRFLDDDMNTRQCVDRLMLLAKSMTSEEVALFKTWLKVFKLVLLVQPSSASAEHVFSLLINSFSSQQESTLEDYVQLSVMLQYNYRKH